MRNWQDFIMDECMNLWQGNQSIGISELSDLFELTPEAIRKYEEKKLLVPFRDKNGYRKYMSWEMTKIIRLRQLRHIGFSLNDVNSLMSTIDLETQLQELNILQQTLAEEIRYKQKLSILLDRIHSELTNFSYFDQACRVEHHSPLYCCVYLVNNTIANKKGEEHEQLKKWIQALPFVHICYIGEQFDEICSCLCVSEEELKLYDLTHLIPDFILPASSYAVCNFVSKYQGDIIDTSILSLKEARKRVEILSKPLSSPIVTEMMWYTQRKNTFASYNKAMFTLLDI